MAWDWKKLVLAVVSAILGWLSGSVVPAPGAAKPVAGVSQVK